MNPLQINTLFFDVGGTLLHPKFPVGQTYAEVASLYGADLNPTELDRGFGVAFKALRVRPPGTIPRDGDDRIWWRSVVRQALGQSTVPKDFNFDGFFADLYATYEQARHWSLYPEVEDTLDILHRTGFRLAIISNWDSRLRKILDGHFLTAFFTEIFISCELGLIKPQNGIYERALKAMGCDASEALMVGDDEENDCLAPQRLGWGAFLVNRPNHDLRNLLKTLMIN